MRINKPLPVLSMDDIIHFWSHVIRKSDSECWLWVGARKGKSLCPIGTPDNYRACCVKIQHEVYIASRISYWIHYQIDPGHLLVCHNCLPKPDNSDCMNPRHLWLGTDSENKQDCWDKQLKIH